jgi:hypothetical protein
MGQHRHVRPWDSTPMNDHIRGARDAFPSGFEAAFPVNDGVLQRSFCTQEWYNHQLDFMHSILGFKPPKLVTLEVFELTRAYAYAFTVYHQMCFLCGHQVAREPNLFHV